MQGDVLQGFGWLRLGDVLQVSMYFALQCQVTLGRECEIPIIGDCVQGRFEVNGDPLQGPEFA